MDVSETLSRQTKVALTLTKHVLQAKARQNSNAVLSPLSIQAVLSVIAAGSNGSTLHQLLRFLDSTSNDQLSHFFFKDIVSRVFKDGSPLGGPGLCFSNSVWIDKSIPLKQAFEQILRDVYKAASNQVDFQTQANQVIREVNSWAEKETNGVIKQVVGPGSLDSLTRLIFANAIYFKGVWSKKFDEEKTKEYDFYLTNGRSVKAPFMTSPKSQYISVFDGFKVLGLDYKQGQDFGRYFRMHIFLPDSVDGLEGLVEKASCESDFLKRHMPRKAVPVGEFRVPKFKISSELDACGIFKDLGLVSPFSPVKADLTKMADDLHERPYVSSIFHKAFIEFNEQGTEAAAFTVKSARFGASPPRVEPEKINFVADHPFLFMIGEVMSGVVLFTGHVINPLLGT